MSTGSGWGLLLYRRTSRLRTWCHNVLQEYSHQQQGNIIASDTCTCPECARAALFACIPCCGSTLHADDVLQLSSLMPPLWLS
jgi:hypothetical protein